MRSEPDRTRDDAIVTQSKGIAVRHRREVQVWIMSTAHYNSYRVTVSLPALTTISFLRKEDQMSLEKNRGKKAADNVGHRARTACEAAKNGAKKNGTTSANGDEFPVGVLPKTLEEMTKAIAESRQVPLALSGGALLAAVAASIGRGLTVESGHGRETSPNLFLLASAGSGVGKSTTMNDAVAPIRRLQEELRTGGIEPQFAVTEKHIPKLERHAAPAGVCSADDEGGGLDELELQLGATGVGAARAVGGVDVLEDDAGGTQHGGGEADAVRGGGDGG
jgi:hypothetical protein